MTTIPRATPQDAEGVSTYLLTLESIERDNLGTRLSPGIRLSKTKDRPAIAKMMQGANLELRRPDGQRSQTVLVTYGVSVFNDDKGTIYLYDNPNDPEIKLILPVDIDPSDLIPGTECGCWINSATTRDIAATAPPFAPTAPE